MASTPEGKLSLRVKLGYGAGDLGGNLFFTVVAFWLMNFLTDEVGLSAGLVGVALMLGKAWDAITDPAVGILSDRTRSRWGRRRPWLLFGSVPLGVSFWLLFTSPGSESQTTLLVWATLVYMLTCTAYTTVNIPYNALTPELTKDFDERTALNGYRMAFAGTGTLIGAGTALLIVGLFTSRTVGYSVMGAVFGGVMTLTALIPFLAVREPEDPPAPARGNILRTYLQALRNRPFVLILVPWVLNTAGVTVVTATMIYYFKYIYDNEALMPIAVAVLIVTAMVFIPIWVKLSERLGKRNTYVAGLTIFIVALMAFFFLGHTLGVGFAFVVMVVAGIGFSTHYVMPWAIVPDTVEYDFAETGLRREGVYYSLWTFMIKLGQAAAGLMVGVILEAFGYVPDVAQSTSALFGIRFLIGPVTGICFGLGILVLLFYPIDKARYAEIQARIAERESRSGSHP